MLRQRGSRVLDAGVPFDGGHQQISKKPDNTERDANPRAL